VSAFPASGPARDFGEEKPPKRLRRVWPLHPLAFALFPLLSLYAANRTEVPWSDLIRPFLVIVGAALVLWAVFRAVAREKQRAAVLLSAFLFLFFFYGSLGFVEPSVTEILVLLAPTRTDAVSPHLYLIPLWVMAAGAVFAVCLRSRRDFSLLTRILNAAGLVLVALPLLPLAAHANRHPAGRTLPARTVPAPAKPHSTLPDIYYIVLDAYGRQDALREFFGCDNEPFLRALEKRGFFVARRARPNYAQTVQSLASSLNMTYLDNVGRAQGKESSDFAPLSQMVDKNAVAAFLRARGYRFVAITNDYSPTIVSSADVVLGSGPAPAMRLTPFEGLLLDKTPLAAFPRAQRSLYDQHRDGVRAAFAHLSDAPALPGPKFVYAHFLAPHPPFVFGPNGEPVTPNRPFTLGDASDFTRNAFATRQQYRGGYVAQLQYVNRSVLSALDAVFARSSRPPIVLVQGDHGSRMLTDWQSLEKTNPREVFANLSAFFLPDGKAAHVFYQDISPVNSFRLLFNHQFGARFARLPDRSFYATMQKPYQFTDVTDQTQAALPAPKR